MSTLVITQPAAPTYEPTEDGYRQMLKDLGWSTQKVTAAITQLRKGKEERVEDFENFKERMTPTVSSEGVGFGMDEIGARKYIVDTFGITPRIARRAIQRAFDRDGEYVGKGYRVVVAAAAEDGHCLVVFPHVA